MAAASQAIFPIRELSAYQRNWTIRARVTMKAPVRTFRSGEGKVFHVELLDAEGGEIRATFFNQAVDLHHDKMETGKIFCFSRGTVKVANRQYNNCNHRYEITFDKDAQVTPAAEGSEIEAVKFTFVDIKSVQTRQLPCRVDLCGIVTAFRAPVQLQSKDGKELLKREITLVDDTATAIDVALWQAFAKTEDSKLEGNPVVALKGVLVREWNGGRAGSLSDTGALVFGASSPEAARVQQWWTQGGSAQGVTQISASAGGGGGGALAANAKPMSLGAMRRAADAISGTQPEIYTCTSRLEAVQLRKKDQTLPLWYSACCEQREGPNGKTLPCNKRVDESGFCPACGRQTKTQVRLLARCRFVDYEDSAWLTTFHEAAQAVLGLTGDEVKVLDPEESLEGELRKRYFRQPLQLILRARQGEYQGEVRTEITCVGAKPVSHAEHGRKLLAEVQEMLAA